MHLLAAPQLARPQDARRRQRDDRRLALALAASDDGGAHLDAAEVEELHHLAALQKGAALGEQHACMVKRSEIGTLDGLWREGHGLSEGSEVMGLSSPVRRAPPRLQMQTDEPVVASYGLAKTAALTMLARP